MALTMPRQKHLNLENLESRLNLSTLATIPLLPTQQVDIPISSVAQLGTTTGRITLADSTAAPDGQFLFGDTNLNSSGSTSIAISGYSSIYNCRLETRSSGQNIGYVSTSGAHVDYVVNVSASGTYNIAVSTAATKNASLDLKVDGSTKASYSLPATGSWDSYRTTSQSVYLTAGKHTLRFQATNGTQYNLKGITASAAGSTTTTSPTTSPTTSTGGTTSVGTSANVSIGSYSSIWNCRLETRSSGQNIGYVSTSGAHVEYKLNVQSAGNYRIDLGMANTRNATMDVLVNGSRAATVSAGATGSWDGYATRSANIYLPSGTVTLRLAATGGTQYNLNKVALAQGSTTAPSNTTTSPTTTTPTTTTSGGNASVSRAWMTSFEELRVTGTTGSDTIVVTQSGSTITIKTNGNTQSVTGNFGDIVVKANGGNDHITIDSSVSIQTRLYGGSGSDTLRNFTRGKATIVSVGGGTDNLTGNGSNTSFWADNGDTVNASWSESSAGRVHRVGSFYGGASMELQGQNLQDPSGTGRVTRLSASSLWGKGPSIDDVRQGQLADCYLMAPLGSFAMQSPDRLREMAVDLGDGTFAVQFKRNGSTQYVRVDADLPSGGPYAHGLNYAYLGSSGNQWAPIMEKAYAIFRTGGWAYSTLNTGWMGQTMSDFGVNNSSITPGWDANSFYNTVSSALNSGRAVTLGTKGSTSGAPVVGYHAYSVVGVSRDSSGSPIFTLRNPWAFDGAGNDGNTGDGLVRLNFSQMQNNFTNGAMAV